MLVMGREVGWTARRGLVLLGACAKTLRSIYLRLPSQGSLEICLPFMRTQSPGGKRLCRQEREGGPIAWREENWKKIQGARREGWMKTLPLTHSCAFGRRSHPLWASVFPCVIWVILH